MPLAPGTRLGAYDIVGLLGAGGMGEVYRARDTTLGRQVALKVVPDRFLADAERAARFRREAQLLASLNHPNIATIHGLEESGGMHALVLELVEGDTLHDLLARHRQGLPLEQVLAVARQVADALDAAHEQGVIHRDLKPANVKVRPDGTVKVLDFGLAKLVETGAASRALEASDTPTRGQSESEWLTQAVTMTGPAVTREGFILGTAAYMSPEQARGKPVDRRADVWAFGCLLYELVAGRRAFEGEEVTSVIARVLERSPDWDALPRTTPPHIVRLMRRCLEKDPRRRLRDIGDARAELDERPVDDAPAPEPIVRREIPRWAGVAAAVLVAATALGGWWFGRATSSPPATAVSRLLLAIRPAEALAGGSPAEREFGLGLARPSRTAIALSPDGRALAFTARREGRQSLYLRPLDRDAADEIPGTTGADGPFFSPDGQWIAFWSNGALRRVSLEGGPPVAIVEAEQPFGASWAEDDRIVFSQRGTIWSVPASGGKPVELTTRPDDGSEFSHAHPRILPGGEWMLFTVLPLTFAWDQAYVAVQSLETGERRTLVEGAADARYVPTGHLVYMRLGNLMAAPFDLGSMTIEGAEVGVIEGVMQAANAGATPVDTGAGQYAFAPDGTLAYVAGSTAPDYMADLEWIRRDGTAETILVPQKPYFAPRLSPDGRSVVVGTFSLYGHDLWRYDLAEGTLTRLTSEGRAQHPIWSPDGSRIAVGYSQGGPYNLFLVRADGSGSPERLATAPVLQFPGAWTPDGQAIAFTSDHSDIMLARLGPEPRIDPLLATPFAERMPDISPDGRWLAYVSNETGDAEVYVQAFPGLGEKRRVSTEGGIEPAWSRDGRRLIFLSPSAKGHRIVEVDVQAGTTLSLGARRVLFERAYVPAISTRAYDLTPDAGRFLFQRESYLTETAELDHVRVVLNWFDELRRRAPASGR
jgi:serine/threonine-protein kinase